MMPLEKIEQARQLWSLGDWQTLLSVPDEDNQNCELGLYVISALLQLGEIELAKSTFANFDLSEEQKRLAIQLLVSGTYNSLGRAHACINDYVRAESLCKQAMLCNSHGPVSNAILNARVTEQFSQMGIPKLADDLAHPLFKQDIKRFLQSANRYFSNEPAYQIALAEYHQLSKQFEKAIVHWQSVSGLLNEEMPQPYYDRLREAYKSVKGFPQGTAEQEMLRGDLDKHFLLSEIHKHLQPEFYFEIGVQTGKSLSLAKCDALGIDPMPMLTQQLPSYARVITSSSDAFFNLQSHLLLANTIDFAFIDGMHLFEYALRDFINVEKYSKPHSLIVIDDIFPGHPDQAKRERCTRAWTGDVWKLKEILEKFRPDLFMLAIDARPTGLLLITALDPDNMILNEKYDYILSQYQSDPPPPKETINRTKALSGQLEYVLAIINVIKKAKVNKASASVLKDALLAVEIKS